MESEYRLLLSNYLLTCDLEEKYLVTLSHLILVKKYGIPVKETKNVIETQLQIPISKRINPNKDYFDYYNVPTGKKERDKIYDECAICEMKEETGITIQELFYIGTNERFRVFPDGKECLCRCTVYYIYIDEQIPIRTEPDKHDDWIFKHQSKKT
ncbi:4513_t:CDS:2 [Dentiscutata erythropus]|uniref:4513_t:CDS:1 n=1 Tax=Dentiscutata erythropus TaxID=1348616 RepID=A0A9N9JQP5_9GLOM|nr:4513_t:CDS:2 [Dentiscutata erythropus]